MPGWDIRRGELRWCRTRIEFSDRPRSDPDFNRCGTGLATAARQFGQRAAGGHDIVHQCHAPASDSWSDRKHAAQIAPSRRCALTDLVGGGAQAAGRSGVTVDSEPVGQYTCQFQRLVVATAAQTAGVQGYRQQQVRQRCRALCQLCGHGLAQPSCLHEAGVIFQAQDRLPYRRGKTERGPGSVERRRTFLAPGADRCAALWQCAGRTG